MHKVYLSLGSNMGDKQLYLDNAIGLLREKFGISKVEVSSYYVTDPIGYVDQDAFMNIAAYVETSLSPRKLLEACQEVEQALNRVRIIHWGPRTIDVDILLFDDLSMDTDDLIIPHKEMTNRGFVLLPLQELNPNIEIDGKSIETYIEQLPPQGVRKL